MHLRRYETAVAANRPLALPEKGMSENPPSLTEDQLDEIRSELLRSLRKIERSMKITNKAARPVKLDQTSVGRLSRIDAIQNQSLTQGLQEREQAKHAAIVGAIGRMDEGKYGICTACGRPIGFERLLIFPEAQMCADCGGRKSL